VRPPVLVVLTMSPHRAESRSEAKNRPEPDRAPPSHRPGIHLRDEQVAPLTKGEIPRNAPLFAPRGNVNSTRSRSRFAIREIPASDLRIRFFPSRVSQEFREIDGKARRGRPPPFAREEIRAGSAMDDWRGDCSPPPRGARRRLVHLRSCARKCMRVYGKLVRFYRFPRSSGTRGSREPLATAVIAGMRSSPNNDFTY
jgi:hypothetical protein